MREYTSLDMSRRLAGVGFKEQPDAGVWGGESGCFHYQETLNSATDWSHMSPAYRADTLLSWLLGEGWDVDVGQLHKPNGKVFIDVVLLGTNKGFVTEVANLPDALGEVVIRVIRATPC